MDELIATYANKLQTIYDHHTAGDHTFTGVLSEFAIKVQAEIASAYEGIDYTNIPECGE
jgi:hypothetical protein